MSPLVVGILVFVILTAGASAVYAAISSGRHVMYTRMAEVAIRGRHQIDPAGAPEAADDHQVRRALLKWAVGRLPKPKADTPKTAKIGELLVQAGFNSPGAPAVFQLSKILATVVGLLLGLMPAVLFAKQENHVVLMAIAGAAIGAWFPGHYLKKRAMNRRIDIGRQLSDVLDLMVVCVEAGLGLLESIKVVGHETEAQKLAIGHELMMVSGEVNAGASLGQALRWLADRTGVDDIKPLAATLIQSEQLGAAIGPALRSISDAIRTRRRLRAEESAQRTTVKILFPLVLMILPAMLLIIVGPAIVQTLRTLSS